MKHYTRKANAKRAIDKIAPGLFASAWRQGLVKFEAAPGFDQPVVCDLPAIKKLSGEIKCL